ncbi:MAG: hypothetical protein JXQ73_32910 [Phycisphaerae bacterium]|nr:hypothetical protein [Phycisphaerae bacterium]
MLTDRALERTGFQEAAPYGERYDLRTDFVMAYGVHGDIAARLKRWMEAGYVPQVMTGVAWGGYQDYLDGKVDGRKHWDEGQVDARGNPIMHGAKTPYMVPAVSFSDYLEEGVQRAIDGGAVAIHLEEPEFWARGGYSEAFKREWRIYYNEPWRRPDESVDAQYRASKLKYYLYQRALDRLCSSMKEYALAKHGRCVRFYVPTHSLINYTQWRIVSPEASLIDLPGVDGYIAQVWTGTARTPNTYAGKTKERTFETGFLEYGIMQELVRGTGRRMWFLADPVEDNPRHDWDDYRRNYLCTLVAQLLHPGVHHYEVCPWPNRVFNGQFPHGAKDPKPIPPDYATILGIVFNQLRDMAQAEAAWGETTEGVGVLLADSGMFQRTDPAFSEGVAKDGSDATRATRQEVLIWSGFYGLALPPLKRGVPIRPVQLDNVARFPGYLKDYKVLLLSYELMKPPVPGIHLALAQWVQAGGALVYVGADTDPFNGVREWWNTSGQDYGAPSEHLFESLGLARKCAEGAHACGKGLVIVERKHPAYFTRSAEGAARLVGLVRQAVERTGGKLVERNHLLLRRGPYVLAACLDESVSGEPLKLTGRFVNLFDASLSVLTEVTVGPNGQAFLLDLDKVQGDPPMVLASAGRIESWRAVDRSLEYTTSAIGDVEVVTRLLLAGQPKSVMVDGKAWGDVVWDGGSGTVLIRHGVGAKLVRVEARW